MKQYLIVIFITLLLHPHLTHAHNGAVAIAVPIEGIMVDGDLSDWPEGMTRYSFYRIEGGEPLTGEEDFKGEFRIGYDEQENYLYLAIEVEDIFVAREPPGEMNLGLPRHTYFWRLPN